MATLVGSLLVALGLDSGEFKSGLSAAEKQLRTATKRFENIGKGMANLGRNLSIGVTAPLVALGTVSVKAAMESQQAIGQVNAALKSMGDGAGRTSEQLQGLASGLMRQSLFDDDEILRKVTANLLTFGNVAGREFDRAQEAAVNLSARMGTDLQSAALMVGKALNSPIKGMAALGRAGIQFTDQQKEQIKALAEVGDAAGAQRIILAELERQFGGSAKAMRDANPMAAAQMSFAEFQETIGEKLLPLLPRITDAIVGVLDAFGRLSPGMQTAVIVVGGLAAALGPVLLGLGGLIQLAAPLLGTVKVITGFAAAASSAAGASAVLSAGFGSLLASIAPFALAAAGIAAAGYLIYQNWDKIAPALQEFWDAIKTALGPAVQELISSVSSLLSELWNGPLGQGIRQVISVLFELSQAWARTFGPVVIEVIAAVIKGFAGLVSAIATGVGTITKLFSGDVPGALRGMLGVFNTIFAGIPAIVGRMVGGVRDWLVNKFNPLAWVRDKIDAVANKFKWLDDVVVRNSYIPDMVDSIGAEMARLDALMVKPTDKATKATEQKFRDLAERVQGILGRLFPQVQQLRDFNKELSDLRAAGLAREDISTPIEKALRAELAGIDLTVPVKLDIDADVLAAPDMSAVDDGLTRIADSIQLVKDRWGEFKEAGAAAFDEVAYQMKGVLLGAQNLGDALRNIVSNLADMALSAAFSALKSSLFPGIPGFANGTNFAPGGLAWVGERGRELVNLPRGSQVIPNHELKNFSNDNNRGPLIGSINVYANDAKGGREAAGQISMRLRRELNGSVRA